ncbi:hypothetical protein Moror_11107 [Moniliophthora roreri MCA 2997]|uniref:Uncharacterized protein n=1 Tax=Moniliophthora roreri (strain MCA 2997) TaxID=1381753 RepID=V2WJ80_MONRO|nr:hypothetical protein Moror_11107 [Moniliophthora roreri MCA 2997]
MVQNVPPPCSAPSNPPHFGHLSLPPLGLYGRAEALPPSCMNHVDTWSMPCPVIGISPQLEPAYTPRNGYPSDQLSLSAKHGPLLDHTHPRPKPLATGQVNSSGVDDMDFRYPGSVSMDYDQFQRMQDYHHMALVLNANSVHNPVPPPPSITPPSTVLPQQKANIKAPAKAKAIPKAAPKKTGDSRRGSSRSDVASVSSTTNGLRWQDPIVNTDSIDAAVHARLDALGLLVSRDPVPSTDISHSTITPSKSPLPMADGISTLLADRASSSGGPSTLAPSPPGTQASVSFVPSVGGSSGSSLFSALGSKHPEIQNDLSAPTNPSSTKNAASKPTSQPKASAKMGEAEKKLKKKIAPGEKLNMAILSQIMEKKAQRKKIAEDHHVKERMVVKRTGRISAIVDQKAPSAYNCLFAIKAAELKKQTLSRGEKGPPAQEVHQLLKQDKELMKLLDDPDEKSEALEAVRTTACLNKEANSVWECSQISVIGFVTRSSFDQSVQAGYFGQGPFANFMKEKLKLTVWDLLGMYESYVCERRAHKGLNTNKLKHDCSAQLSVGLEEVTHGKVKAMNFKHFKSVIQEKHKVHLVGWLENVPFMGIHDLPMVSVQALHDVILSGALKWEKMQPHEFRAFQKVLENLRAQGLDVDEVETKGTKKHKHGKSRKDAGPVKKCTRKVSKVKGKASTKGGSKRKSKVAALSDTDDLGSDSNISDNNNNNNNNGKEVNGDEQDSSRGNSSEDKGLDTGLEEDELVDD